MGAPSRVVMAGLTIVALACGKRAYVPAPAESAEPGPSAAPPSSAFATSTAIDASVRSIADDDEPEPVPAGPLATTCRGVSLVIVSVNAGHGEFDAVVELRNASAEHVPLMLTGDGSSGGRRNPALTFALTPNNVAPQMGCGNMNRLSPHEIVFLAPGQHAKLGWLNPPRPSKPGRYSLRATYRNDPTSDSLGDNRPGPRTDALIARVRKTVPCTLVSNTVSFTW